MELGPCQYRRLSVVDSSQSTHTSHNHSQNTERRILNRLYSRELRRWRAAARTCGELAQRRGCRLWKGRQRRGRLQSRHKLQPALERTRHQQSANSNELGACPLVARERTFASFRSRTKRARARTTHTQTRRARAGRESESERDLERDVVARFRRVWSLSFSANLEQPSALSPYLRKSALFLTSCARPALARGSRRRARSRARRGPSRVSRARAAPRPGTRRLKARESLADSFAKPHARLLRDSPKGERQSARPRATYLIERERERERERPPRGTVGPTLQCDGANSRARVFGVFDGKRNPEAPRLFGPLLAFATRGSKEDASPMEKRTRRVPERERVGAPRVALEQARQQRRAPLETPPQGLARHESSSLHKSSSDGGERTSCDGRPHSARRCASLGVKH